MVYLLGTGRMAVMARLLAAGSLSQNIGEEISQHKLATQCIYREFHEADEANLLDEEDMHVFGLKPMTDHLDLVLCNACKKPLKTSQYAAHAVLCRSFSSAEETTLEIDGSSGQRKPPRKEKKKSLAAHINQAIPVAEHERSASIDADDTAASESHLDGQPGISSSFSIDAKNGASMMDGKGVSPDNTDHSACVMPPPAKRSKLVSSQHLLLSNHPEAVSALTRIRRAQDTFTCGHFQLQSTSGSSMPNDCVVPNWQNGHCLLTKDIPVPLATKTYYSQRNNRLRSAVAHMYREASAKGLSSNVMSPQVSGETMIQTQASSHILRGCSIEQIDDLFKKKEPSTFKPDQILAQSSELCLDKSGGSIPAANFSQQFPVNKTLRSQTAPVGLLRSKYISKPYSFAGNSGQLVGTIQQPSGSVPVL